MTTERDKNLNEQETVILQALCCGEDAKTLTTLVDMINLSYQEVAATVDGLEARTILMRDVSFATSAIGSVVYSFADHEVSQAAYASLQRPCEGMSCPNDAEYLFLAEEKKIYHARFCQPHRKSIIRFFPKMQEEEEKNSNGRNRD